MCIRLHDDYIACDEKKKIFNRIAKLFFFKINEHSSETDFEFTFSISRLIFDIYMHWSYFNNKITLIFLKIPNVY